MVKNQSQGIWKLRCPRCKSIFIDPNAMSIEEMRFARCPFCKAAVDRVRDRTKKAIEERGKS
jgi:rRNA maturation endonuclease Nob1